MGKIRCINIFSLKLYRVKELSAACTYYSQRTGAVMTKNGRYIHGKRSARKEGEVNFTRPRPSHVGEESSRDTLIYFRRPIVELQQVCVSGRSRLCAAGHCVISRVESVPTQARTRESVDERVVRRRISSYSRNCKFSRASCHPRSVFLVCGASLFCEAAATGV